MMPWCFRTVSLQLCRFMILVVNFKWQNSRRVSVCRKCILSMFIGDGENAKTLKYIVTRFFYRGIPGVAYNAVITGCRAGVVKKSIISLSCFFGWRKNINRFKYSVTFNFWHFVPSLNLLFDFFSFEPNSINLWEWYFWIWDEGEASAQHKKAEN